MNELPVLADIDGVLRIGKKPAEGLSEFFGFLNDFRIQTCLISNSTLSSSKDIQDFFKEINIDTLHPVMTASDATANYVKQNYSSAAVYCAPEIKRLFAEVITDKEDPEAVVIQFDIPFFR